MSKSIIGNLIKVALGLVITGSILTPVHADDNQYKIDRVDAVKLNRALLINSNNKSLSVLEYSYSSLKKRLTNHENEKMDRNLIYDKQDWSDIADLDWFNRQYKFKDEIHKKNIEIINSFKTLPEDVLKENLSSVEYISSKSNDDEKKHALYDAEGEYYLYYEAEALGSELGKAFINAYDKGNLKKTTALLRASDIQVDEEKEYFKYPRPFTVKGNGVSQIKDNILFNDNKLYSSSPDASFPSGHTYSGNITSLLLANMIPERFGQIILRGADYGYSRVVLGVHYPLDVIASRILTQYNAATWLSDDKYSRLFNEAKSELRTAIEKECNTKTIAECIAKNDPNQNKYSGEQAQSLFAFTLNYNLPKVTVDKKKFVVPDNSVVLLKSALPKLSKQEIKDVLSETALPYGDALSTSKYGDWQRINLLGAYLKGVEISNRKHIN